MTIKEFKTLGGLFIVMLSFGLLYAFNMVEPDYVENVHSNDNVATTDNITEEVTEHETNGSILAGSMRESEESAEDNDIQKEEKRGLISSGTIIKQLNYDVSTKN